MKQRLLKLITVTAFFIIGIIVLSSGILKSTGGGRNDLVDEIYKQEVNKNATLEKIEIAIKNYYSKKQDAIEEYNKYNDYNKRYYADAKNNLNYIGDATLKEKAKKLIEQSEKNYWIKISEWNKQIAEMGINESILADHHSLLKLMIATPLIEQYQGKNLPSTGPIQENNTELKKVIESIKAITDK